MDNRLTQMAVFNEIIELLDRYNVSFEHIKHDKAITSMDTFKVTGLETKYGAKSIVFKTKKGFKLVIVRGDNRADFKKLRNHFGVNKIRLATVDEVLKVMRVPVGACYPFGEVAGIEMIVDQTLANGDKVNFSPGTHFDHITMSYNDYALVTKPKLVDIVLDE